MRTSLSEIHQTATLAGLKRQNASETPSIARKDAHVAISAQPNALIRHSLIERWRHHYTTVRPHSALGYRPPAPESMMPIDQRPTMH